MSLLVPDSEVIMTVLGETHANWDGLVDAHNHVWISPVQETSPKMPVLNRFEPILEELKEFYRYGGRGIIDCQPGGCGRDARKLALFSKQSGVHIVCCTGFHKQEYYPKDKPLLALNSERLFTKFTNEIMVGVEETVNTSTPIHAGFIKVAIETNLSETPKSLLEAATFAAINNDAAIEVHTEKGSDAEKVLEYFIRFGVNPKKVIICHMDKRPDLILHQDLAKAGALLEYDTFFREQYNPEKNLWPLLLNMISNGYENDIALATDMAETHMWRLMGNGPGLIGISIIIKSRLEQEGVHTKSIKKLLNQNIMSRLIKPSLNIKR